MTDILSDIRCFLEQTGMAPSSFGRAVAGDPRLVHDLTLGRCPREPLIQRVGAFIARPLARTDTRRAETGTGSVHEGRISSKPIPERDHD